MLNPLDATAHLIRDKEHSNPCVRLWAYLQENGFLDNLLGKLQQKLRISWETWRCSWSLYGR